MSKFYLLLFFSFLFVTNSFAADQQISTAEIRLIEQAIAKEGSSFVIVGLADPASAASVSRTSMVLTKSTFLNSVSITNSKRNNSIEIVDQLVNIPYVVVKVNNSSGLATLQLHTQVKTIEANREFKAALRTSVPRVHGFSNPWSSAAYNGSGSWVAIIDSGVYTNHPMFSGKSIIQACFVTDSSCNNNTNTQYGGNAANPAPKGKSDHGTHVAGIAVGRYIASQRMAGVAPGANLIALQVFTRAGRTGTASMVRALNYVYSLAASRRIAAANMSIQGQLFTQACDTNFPSMLTVIKKLRNRKVATVIAAGNQGDDVKIAMPSCLSEGIAVANATKSYGISQSSNRNTMVSLIAPGTNIRSATIGSGYSVKTGTSMAAPMIAGAFAVMRKFKPTASVSAIEAALQNASRLVKDTLKPGDDYHHPWPLLNKARTNLGGTTKKTTAVGFNTGSSINRFNKISSTNWGVSATTVLGANGVAFNFGSVNQTSALAYPQTILTGRVAARLRFLNGGGGSYGIMVRQGGSIEHLHTTSPSSDFHDGYRFGITDSGYYSVFKYEHGKIIQVVSWTFNPGIVKMNNWNTLLATTGGKTVKFYINGVLVGQHSSNRLIYGGPGIHSYKTTINGTVYVDWFVTKSNSTSVGYRSLTSGSKTSQSTASNAQGLMLNQAGCPESPDPAICAAIQHKNTFRAQTLNK